MTSTVKPLINVYDNVDTRTLQDGWLEVAREIEASLINAGAIPGEDYSYLDLYQFAQPIVMKLIDSGDIKP